MILMRALGFEAYPWTDTLQLHSCGLTKVGARSIFFVAYWVTYS